MSVDGVKQTLIDSKDPALLAEIKKAIVEEVDRQEVDLESVRDKQMILRCSEAEKERWKRTADVAGMTVSDWFRYLADQDFRLRLGCIHPYESRRVYPWATICLRCGERFEHGNKK